MGYWQQNKKSSAVTQFHWKGEKVIDIMNTMKIVMFQDCHSLFFCASGTYFSWNTGKDKSSFEAQRTQQNSLN